VPGSSYHPHPALPLPAKNGIFDKGEGKVGGELQSFWTPVFTGVMTFYEFIKYHSQIIVRSLIKLWH
jgi:hypothetical protein